MIKDCFLKTFIHDIIRFYVNIIRPLAIVKKKQKSSVCTVKSQHNMNFGATKGASRLWYTQYFHVNLYRLEVENRL